MSKKILAIDVETRPISYARPVPELICMSYDLEGEEHGILVPWGNGLPEFVIKHLRNPDVHIVGHNIAFDLSVLCWMYGDSCDIVADVFRALDQDRIHDTMIRERLHILASNGDFNVLHTGGRNVKLGYSLADLEKKYLGIDRSAIKKDKDSVRYNFEQVIGLPVCDWPDEFVEYSQADAVNTLVIFRRQEEAVRHFSVEHEGIDPLKVSTFRTRVAWGLRLLEAVGERLDPNKVIEVTKQYEEAYNKPELVEPLVESGLLVPGQPPQPYAKGTKEHRESCVHHKNHPEYKAGRPQRCDCPPKMKKGTSDKMPTKVLQQYIWDLARQGIVEAWPTEKTLEKLPDTGYPVTADDRKFTAEYIEAHHEIPDFINLQTDEEWIARFADKD